MKNENYICHVPYLSNSIAYDHNFWLYLCKMMISSTFFSFFQNFDFLGCYRGKRAKNDPKLEEKLSVVLPISGILHHMIVICGTQLENDDIW